MRHLNRKLNRRGQGLVEYILVVFLMAIVCIGVVNKLSEKTQDGFEKATTKLGKEFSR